MPQNQQSAMTMSHVSSATTLMFWGNFWPMLFPLPLLISLIPHMWPSKCRLSSQSSFSLACKMRWFPRPICKCCMPKRLLIIGDAFLRNFLLACIWILGSLVVIIIGERSRSFFNNMFKRKKMMNHLTMILVRFWVMKYSKTLHSQRHTQR